VLLTGWIIQSGFTALHVAARYGNNGVAQLLIEYGADVNFVAKVYNLLSPSNLLLEHRRVQSKLQTSFHR